MQTKAYMAMSMMLAKSMQHAHMVKKAIEATAGDISLTEEQAHEALQWTIDIRATVIWLEEEFKKELRDSVARRVEGEQHR